MSDQNQRIDPALLADANPAGLNPNDAVNGGLRITERPRGIRRINKKGIFLAAGAIGVAAIVAATTFNGTSGAAADAARDAAAGQSKNRPVDMTRDTLWYTNVSDKVEAATPDRPIVAGAVAAPAPGSNAMLAGGSAVPDLTGQAVNPLMAATAGRTNAAPYQAGGAGAAGAPGGAPGAAPVAPAPMTPEQQLAHSQEQQRQQNLESAKKAGLNAGGFGTSTLAAAAGGPPSSAGPLADAISKMGALSGLGRPGAPMPMGMPGRPDDDPNKQGQKEGFLKGQRDASDADYANSMKTPQRSPFELKAGAVIPSVMIGGINSDLPGQVIAQVRENVFDTKTGQHLLIPQGSRLVGKYDSHVAYGQRRVLMAWSRLIYPNGDSFNLQGMPGADKSGFSGFSDQVDNHYFRIFGSAALMSIISAGVQLSQPNNNGSGNNNAPPSASQVAGAALGQQIGQTAMSITQKNLNIQPTLEIRPGYQFNVMVTADMILPPPVQN